MFELVEMHNSIRILSFWLTTRTGRWRIFASDFLLDVGMSVPTFTLLQNALNACFTEMLWHLCCMIFKFSDYRHSAKWPLFLKASNSQPCLLWQCWRYYSHVYHWNRQGRQNPRGAKYSGACCPSCVTPAVWEQFFYRNSNSSLTYDV